MRALRSLSRILIFLKATARQDYRLYIDNTAGRSRYVSGHSTAGDGIELDNLASARFGADDHVITLRDASFGWNTEKTALHNIDLQVNRGSLLMVIGPTGCGKGTLLKGILGEARSFTGFVYLATQSIAFADQDPWTISSTIRSGACGESPSDETFYQEVIDCCCLREDLDNLPKGDMTVVGSKGISLSGGQKHRLALARAVFARKDVVIMDDVFSGLDADAEEYIFLSQDLNLVHNVLPHVFIASILQLALFLIGGGLMVSTASYFAATIPFVIAALVAIQRYYLRTSRQMRHLDLEAKVPLYTHFQETLSGLVSVRAFGWVEQFCEKNLELTETSQRPFYLMFCIQRRLAIVLDLLVTALATLLMVMVVLLRKKIDPDLVGLGLHNVMSFNESMSEMIKYWTMTETSIGAVARLSDFSNNTESENKPIESSEPDPEWPRMDGLEICNFTASYSESSELVLKGINLHIEPGEKVGICGRTGSGKSSLLASLLHLLEFRNGFICIDGQDIALVPRDLLRQRLNVIPQEPYWVAIETIRFNLDSWETEFHDYESLMNVLTRCQIWDTIASKGGLDAKMDVDFLSHGQRQLFCLARSLLKKSKVVILDEVSAR